MIAMLTGEVKLVDLQGRYIFLNVSRGISYLVYVVQEVLDRLANPEYKNSELSLYVFTVYKENDVKLYGFEALEERNMFEQLLSVKGVGPNTSMSILSQLTLEEIILALDDADNGYKVFASVSGIGETTAKNIMSKLG